MLNIVARLRGQARLSLGNGAVRLALHCSLLGVLCASSSAQNVQGLPVVGAGGTSQASSQMLIDATLFGSGTDMCGAIKAACAQLGLSNYPKGATIDARGYTGNQVCSAGTATTMLNGCVTGTNHNGGKLLLGNVNLYIDGPVPPATSYTDGSSGVGTPAIIIPSFFWGIEGVSRGATANGTNAGLGTFISPCPTSNPPTNCDPTAHPFPVRSCTVNSTTVATTSGVTTMTISVSPALSWGSTIGAIIRGQTGRFPVLQGVRR
jgi:hypothetical protein